MRCVRVVGVALLLAFLSHSAAAARADDRPTVAVLYFDYDGSDEAMGFLRKGLTQMLVTDLVGVSEIQVVERARLEEVLAELELNRTKKINKKSATRIGKLLGARYLVMGGYFDIKGSLRIDARVIDVETGKVVFSVGTTRKVADFMALERHLGGELGKFLASELTAGTAKKRAKVRKTARKKKTAKTATKKIGRAGAAKPDKLHARTAARYGKALDSIDRGKKEVGRRELQAIVDAEPDFGVAALDLKALAK